MNNLILANNSLLKNYDLSDILKCNDVTKNYGLTLTQNQAHQLVKTRGVSLKRNGRFEFSNGIIEKIITEFCDSPYISTHNYTETINELIDIFYQYKNDSLDLMGDDELLSFMHKSFDGVCEGSLELLSDRELERMARNLRFGRPFDYDEDDDDDIIDEEDDYNEEYC